MKVAGSVEFVSNLYKRKKNFISRANHNFAFTLYCYKISVYILSVTSLGDLLKLYCC